MKKLIKFLLVALMIVPLAACDFFYNGEDKKNEGPAWLNQSFVGTNEASVSPLADAENTKKEKDVLSIKLLEGNKGYLIVNGRAYYGTYVVDENDENKVTFTRTDRKWNGVLQKYETSNHNYSINFGEKSLTINDEGNEENKDIKQNSVVLNKKSDFDFKNGLYVSIASYYEGEYEAETGSTGYTLKVSDNEIYTADGSDHFNYLDVVTVGDNIVYTYYSDYNKSVVGRVDLFFVEKKGNHDAEFVNLVGDLDYVIYSIEDEGGAELSKYFDAPVSEMALKITSDLTMSATAIYVEEFELDTLSKITANLSLTIKADGNVTFSITGNDDYNISTSGKWYNINSGVIVKLDNKNFFGGIFAIGCFPDSVDETYSKFVSNGRTYLDKVEILEDDEMTTRYEIGWGVESAAELENYFNEYNSSND